MKKQLKRGQFPLSDKEIQKIINNEYDLRNRVLIQLIYYCGLRRDEVSNIEIRDIDQERRRIRVIGKGNKERLVVVPQRIMDTLSFYLQMIKGKYLFPAKKIKKQPICKNQINRILRAAGERAQIKNPHPNLKYINPHALRHSYVHELKKNGVSIEAIAAVLGHTDIKTTMDEYGCLSIDDIQEDIEKVFA